MLDATIDLRTNVDFIVTVTLFSFPSYLRLVATAVVFTLVCYTIVMLGFRK